MKPCQFMLALSLFCGGIHNTSANGSCGFFPVLIEQEDGDRLFSEPKVHEAQEEQTEVVCQGMACSPVLSFPVVPASRETERAGWEPGASKWTPDPSNTAELSLHNKSVDLDSIIGAYTFFSLWDQIIPSCSLWLFHQTRASSLSLIANCWVSPDSWP